MTNTYSEFSTIPYYFYWGNCVSIGTDIYLVGGHDNHNYKYDTLTDTYTQLVEPPYSTYYGGVAVIKNDIYVFGGGNYPTKVQVYTLESKTYTEDNLVVIYPYRFGYEVELYSNSKDITPPKYSFYDAWYYTLQGGLETNIPTYYGNGTSWVKFKN